MIQATCPDCGKVYNVADKMAGRTAKCRECGGLIPVTAAADSSPPGSTVTAVQKPVEAHRTAAAQRVQVAPPDRRPDASSDTSRQAADNGRGKPLQRRSAASGQAADAATPARRANENPEPAQRRRSVAGETSSTDNSRSRTSSRPGSRKSDQSARASQTRRPPARKKPSGGHSDDDLFEDDDYEAYDDYDDGHDDYEDYGSATDGYDDYDDYGPSDYGRPSRSSSRKPKKKKKKSGRNFSFNLSFLFSDLTEGTYLPFVIWAVLSAGIALAVRSFGLFDSGRVTFLFAFGMVGAIMSGLWLTVTNFRVNPVLAAVIIGSAGLNKTLARSGLLPVSALLTLGVFVIQIYLIVTNWDRYWKVTLCYVGSLVSLALLFYLTTFHDLSWGNATSSPTEQSSPASDLASSITPVSGGQDEDWIVSGSEFRIGAVPGPDFMDLVEDSVAGDAYRRYRIGLHPFPTTVRFPDPAAVPGRSMTLRLFTPVDKPIESLQMRSIGCVMVTGAGTPLLYGTDAPDRDYDDEFLPYIQAGYAVLAFSVDGDVADRDNLTDPQFAAAYKLFRRACAGVINARNAARALHRQVPQVDPDRIYIAGHSSAATLALLATEHVPEIKGCMAYAPATDLEQRLRETYTNPLVARLLPDVANFVRQSSPLTHIGQLQAPVFLFHATDDTNTPVVDSRRFQQLARSNGKDITYEEVPTGNHYQSMIDQGIPRAISWLQALEQRQSPRSKAASATTRPTPADLPQADSTTAGSRRILTFKRAEWRGTGDPILAARTALAGVPWVDPNQVEFDAASGELVMGLRGGSINTVQAQQALQAAGFVIGPGVSITPR